jgi:hypothetical protein
VKAKELAAILLREPEATVEVCVRENEDNAIDYLVADAIPVENTEEDEPWITIILGEFVCDHA